MNLDEATSLNGSLPILEHPTVVWKREVVGKGVQCEAAHFADLVTVGTWLASLDLACEDDQDNRLVLLGVDAHQTREPHGESYLLEDFAQGRVLEDFASVNGARGKTPHPAARVDTTPTQPYAAFVAQDDRHGHLRVEIVHEAARRTRRSLTILVVARFERCSAQKAETDTHGVR
jgi:hypothetical protein